jgi:tetratricopeptide (TPR) repeat protein
MKASNIKDIENKAISFYDKRVFSKAKRLFLGLLNKECNNITAHFYLTRIYCIENDIRKSIYHGLKTLKINPNEKNANLNIGLSYELNKNYRRALYYYKKEIILNPSSQEACYNIGNFFYEKNQWKKAIPYLQKCFESGYKNNLDQTVYNLGTCYYKLRKIDLYISLYSRFLEINNKVAWAAYNLAGAYFDKHQYKKAALMYSKARKLGIIKDTDEQIKKSIRKLNSLK